MVAQLESLQSSHRFVGDVHLVWKKKKKQPSFLGKKKKTTAIFLRKKNVFQQALTETFGSGDDNAPADGQMLFFAPEKNDAGAPSKQR